VRKILSLITCIVFSHYNYSQNLNTITTAVPFLLINPNAQSMGIGDIGVVAAADYYESGLTQNPALLSRNEKMMGAKFSYKPWLRNLVPDVNMIDASMYYAITKKITVGYSYNLFSLGIVTYTDANGIRITDIKPKESYHNLRYAQSLSPNLSLGLGLKYIVSDLTNGQPFHGMPTRAGKAIAGDIGIDYRKEIAKKETSFWRYDVGASILNMGNKVKYMDTTDGDFLPMQLAVGTMWTFTNDIDETTRYCIDLAYQCEKLLVPTPPLYEIDSTGRRHIIAGKDPNVSVAQGAFQSFNDAPGGRREEFAEIIHKIGIENRFTFDKKWTIAMRAGFFNESERKGNRRYVNAGIGGKYKFIYLDLSMILLYRNNGIIGHPTYASGIRNPNSINATIGFKYTFKQSAKKDKEPEEKG
jgi:hypothetical protein